MDTRRWLNPSQPQTLQYAVMLLYINAALALLLSLGQLGLIGLLLVGAGIAGGYGIANEHKWGYGVALAVAFAPFILSLLLFHTIVTGGLISFAFDVLLVGLLLHTQSRNYQRIWFK